jgi:hypothetical protein
VLIHLIYLFMVRVLGWLALLARSDAVGDLVAGLEPAGEAEAVRLLGAYVPGVASTCLCGRGPLRWPNGILVGGCRNSGRF